MAWVTTLGQQLVLKRNDRRSFHRVTLSPVLELVGLVRFTDSGDGHVGTSKERGELVKILLLPIVAKIVIVTLDAVDAHAKERRCYSRGQLYLIGIILFLVLIDRHGDKVNLRVVGPESLSGDQ